MTELFQVRFEHNCGGHVPGSVHQESKGEARELVPLFRRWLKEPGHRRESAALALGTLGDGREATIRPLRRVLEDECSWIDWADAARALGAIGEDAVGALPVLWLRLSDYEDGEGLGIEQDEIRRTISAILGR